MSEFEVYIEPECACSFDDPDGDINQQKLSDWHDLTHGLTLWANCTHEPCSILTDEFRSSH